MKTGIKIGLTALLLYSATVFGMDASAPTSMLAPSQPLLQIPKSQFKPLPDNPSQYVYIKPNAHLDRYTQIWVAPLVILNKETGKQWQALVSDENGQAAQIFQQAMVKALKDRGVRVSDQPGPGVITLRVAVTHVQQDKEGFVASDILPIKAIFNVARMAAGMEKYIVNIDTLGQLEDSQSGELLAGGFGIRKQSKSGPSAISLDDFASWTQSWSQDVALRLAKTLPATLQTAGAPQN